MFASNSSAVDGDFDFGIAQLFLPFVLERGEALAFLLDDFIVVENLGSGGLGGDDVGVGSRGFDRGKSLLEIGDFAVAFDDHAVGDADGAFDGESFLVAHAADSIIGFAFELGDHAAFGGFPILDLIAALRRGGGLAIG